MEEIVKVVNLTKNFYTKEGEMEVLKNISFTLQAIALIAQVVKYSLLIVALKSRVVLLHTLTAA